MQRVARQPRSRRTPEMQGIARNAERRSLALKVLGELPVMQLLGLAGSGPSTALPSLRDGSFAQDDSG